MPGFREIPSLQALAMISIGYHIAKQIPVISQQVAVASQQDASSLLYRLRLLNESMSSNITFYLREYMSDTILNALSEVLERPGVLPPHPNILAEMSLVHHLRSLDLSQWSSTMRGLLSNVLPDLKSLRHFTFGYSLYFDSKPFNVTGDQIGFIMNSLSQMKQLRSLYISFFADDTLVEAIARNCKELRCLSVSESPGVTNDSVRFLKTCTSLNELNITSTRVTVPSYAVLLENLPNLEILSIGPMGEYDVVAQHFDAIGPYLNLKKLMLSDLTTPTLDLMVHTFPNIDTIAMNDFEGDLTVLSHLTTLTNLIMASCNCHENTLETFLLQKGINIHVLMWKNMKIHKAMWSNLSTFCPNLRELTYSRDSTPRRPRRPLYDNRDPTVKIIPRFFHLIKLKWMANDQRSLILLLKLATDVKYLRIGEDTPLEASDLYDIRCRYGSLKKLEAFVVTNSKHLTLEIPCFLLANCKRINVIADLKSWVNVPDVELGTIERYLKTNNFDVMITWSIND